MIARGGDLGNKGVADISQRPHSLSQNILLIQTMRFHEECCENSGSKDNDGECER